MPTEQRFTVVFSRYRLFFYQITCPFDSSVLQLPQELAVGADYGIIVLDGAPVEAWRLAMFILGTEGQKILAKHGFVGGGVTAH